MTRAVPAGIADGPGQSTGRKESHGHGVAVAPLVPLLVATCAGIVLDRYLDPCSTGRWILLGLPALAIAAIRARRPVISVMAILLAFACLGGAWHHAWWWDMEPDDLAWSLGESPRPAWVRGMVLDLPRIRTREGYRPDDPEQVTTGFTMDIRGVHDGSSWLGASGRASVVVMGDRRDIRPGIGVEAAGMLARIPGPLNPGEFDYRAFLQARGIRLRLTADSPEAIRDDPRGVHDRLTAWLGEARAGSRWLLFDRIEPRAAPLASALILGRREDVDPDLNDAFALTGTTHLLAISGLHLQVVALALGFVLQAVRVPGRAVRVAVALAVIGYSLLVGLAPSVVRSAAMTVTFCLAALCHRPSRPANTLALAGLATLGFNPLHLFDVGCQLSFLAIAALIWLVPPAGRLASALVGAVHDRVAGPTTPLDEFERKLQPWWRGELRRVGRAAATGVLASLVVWLAALPLVALRFHLVSPIGVLLNIPLIPITSLALLLGGASMGLALIWGPLGGPAGWAAGWLLGLTESIVSWGAGLPWGHRFVAGPTWGWVVVFYVLLGLAALLTAGVRGRARQPGWSGRRPSMLVWGLVCAWIVPGWLGRGLPGGPGRLEGDVLAVGHGLAVLLRIPGGRTMLYDCGRMGDPRVGRRIVAPAVWSLGLSRLDTVVLSHADQDHYNGLPDLLDRVTIGEVLIPPRFVTEENPGAGDLLARCRARGIPIRTIAAPRDWTLGGATLRALHPPDGWHPEASDNARSLVLDLAHGGRHLLLTGDLDQLGLVELSRHPRPVPPVDLMLAPHHGGRSANPDWLYRWAGPRTVVVSQRIVPTGAGDALASLERQGIPVLRTWERGAVHLAEAPEGIEVRGFLDEDDRGTGVHPGEGGPVLAMFPIGLMSVGLPGPMSWRTSVAVAGFIVGLLIFLVLAIVEHGAWALVVPPRARGTRRGEGDGEPPGSVAEEMPGPEGEPLTIEASDGVRLAGLWYPARGVDAGGKVVILIHGFAEASDGLRASRVSALNQSSRDVLAIDLRGYGASGGTFASFGGREADDIRAWVDALARRAEGGGRSIRPVLWGRSMGAAIAVRAAANDRRIEAVVLESPMVDLVDAMAVWFGNRRFPMARTFARLVVGRAGKLAGVPLNAPRPIDVASRVACPALVVHGAADTLVPGPDARRLARAFPSPAAYLDVPGAGHVDVVQVGGDSLLREVTGFLDRAQGGTVDGA